MNERPDKMQKTASTSVPPSGQDPLSQMLEQGEAVMRRFDEAIERMESIEVAATTGHETSTQLDARLQAIGEAGRQAESARAALVEAAHRLGETGVAAGEKTAALADALESGDAVRHALEETGTQLADLLERAGRLEGSLSGTLVEADRRIGELNSLGGQAATSADMAKQLRDIGEAVATLTRRQEEMESTWQSNLEKTSTEAIATVQAAGERCARSMADQVRDLEERVGQLGARQETLLAKRSNELGARIKTQTTALFESMAAAAQKNREEARAAMSRWADEHRENRLAESRAVTLRLIDSLETGEGVRRSLEGLKDQVAEMLNRAGRLQQPLSASLDDAAERIGALTSLHETTDKLTHTLANRLQTATLATDELEDRQSRVEEASRSRLEQAVNDKLALLEETGRRSIKAYEAHAQSTLQTQIERIVARQKTRFDEQAQRLHTTLEDQATALSESLTVAAREERNAVRNALTEWLATAQQEQMREVKERSMRLIEALTQTGDCAAAALDQAQGRAGALEERLDRCLARAGEAVEEITARGGISPEALARLAELPELAERVDRAGRITEDAGQRIDELQTLHTKAETVAQALREHLRESAQLADVLHERRAGIERELDERLDETVTAKLATLEAVGRDALTGIEQAQTAARAQIERQTRESNAEIESHTVQHCRAAAEELRALHGSCVEAAQEAYTHAHNAFVKTVTETTNQDLEKRRAMATQLAESLEGAGQRASEQLTRLEARAAELEERLARRTVHAGAAAERLAAAVTAADAAEQRTGDLNDLIGQANRAGAGLRTEVRAAGECHGNLAALQGQLQQAIATAADTCAEHNARIDELRTAAAKGGKLLGKLIRAGQEAHETITRCVATTTRASDTVGELQRHTEHAARTLAEHRNREDESRELLTSLHGQTASAEDVAQRLAGTLARGGELLGSLEQAHDGAAQSLDRLETYRHQAERLAQEMVEFEDRHATVKSSVDRLGNDVQAAQTRLNSLLSEPQQLVGEARNEAIKLKDVCRAVRRVFAGLSETSLEAHQRIEAFSALASETSRSAETLRTWVEEAINARERLARTLERVPSVTQTHAPEPLISLQNAVQREIHRGVPRLTSARTPPDRSTMPPPNRSTPSAQARLTPDEITALLREAEAGAGPTKASPAERSGAKAGTGA